MAPGKGMPLRVTGFGEQDLSARYFTVAEGSLINSVPVMPALISTDARIVRQDCLCYLMERMNVPEDDTSQKAKEIPL